MNTSEQANPKIAKIIKKDSNSPVESFNYLNLEDSILTHGAFKEEKNKKERTSECSGVRRMSKGIIKVVHQISKYEEEEDNDDNNSIDMTSQILAEEIFSPIVW